MVAGKTSGVDNHATLQTRAVCMPRILEGICEGDRFSAMWRREGDDVNSAAVEAAGSCRLVIACEWGCNNGMKDMKAGMLYSTFSIR